MSATPPQGIDRGDVAQVLAEVRHEGLSIFDGVDRILALVRPVEGTTLTPEEVHTVLGWQQIALGEGAAAGPSSRALAARLEAAL